MFDQSLKVENEVLGKCPKCGLQLTHTMYYVCAKDACPCGLGRKGEFTSPRQLSDSEIEDLRQDKKTTLLEMKHLIALRKT